MLSEQETQAIVQFVKTEPRTVQEIAQHIGKSWVTADAHVEKIRERTGLLSVKSFRKGTQGALKLVYYNYSESLGSDEVKANLYTQIRASRFKHHFDFMEIFQFVPEKHKKSQLQQYTKESESIQEGTIPLLREAQSSVYIFSGNFSFVNVKEGKTTVLAILEELLERKVRIKILCRVNLGAHANIQKLTVLLQKYPNLIEIRHAFQPLRGFIVDEKVARFKDEEQLAAYKAEELVKNTRIFYDIYDEAWVAWLQQVFWNMYRVAIDHKARWKEIEKIV
jgi:hypothetical protein